MDFITISVQCEPKSNDFLIAQLFEIGFDSFQEFENGFEGSCDRTSFNEQAISDIIHSSPGTKYSIKEQEKINWNEEWEKNYDPITVDDKCLVRATFHIPDREYDYEIIVNPKMSFGTGHHATTYQVLSFQMTLDHQHKKVLDVGCGTGILSIMAAKRGAQSITATDIDDWCIENSQENFSLNEITVQLIKGQIDVVKDSGFDIVIANINKNVLLSQIKDYANLLVTNGCLVLSGFYEDDVEELTNESAKHGLKLYKQTTRENWGMLALVKQGT